MKSFNKLSFILTDGEFTTSEYSSVEVMPAIDDILISNIIIEAISNIKGISICREYSPKLSTCLPYLDIYDYGKLGNPHKKRFLYCTNSCCKCSCWFHFNIHHFESVISIEQFVQWINNHPVLSNDHKRYDNQLDIRSVVFDRAEYFNELERVKRILISKEQMIELKLPTALLRIYHNDKVIPFFVRGARTRTWVYPDNDANLCYEAFAEACVDILIPIEDKEINDIIIAHFDNIVWEHNSSDERIVTYEGYNEGYWYGITIPDDESWENEDGKPSTPFFVEPLCLYKGLTISNFRDIQYEIAECDDCYDTGYIVMTLAWCSDKNEHAKDIATNVTW